MDPVRQLVHLYLRTADEVLSRTLDVVRLVDGLLVSSAQANVAAEARRESWPAEETGDLSGAADALRARAEGPPAKRAAAKKSVSKPAAKKSTSKKAPAKKAPAKKAPAKKTAAKKTGAKGSA